MDLAADHAVGADDDADGRDRTRTPSSSTRCAASRARASSPGSTPTRPASAPTPPTTRHRRSARRLAGVRGPRQPRARVQRRGCRRPATRPASSASSSTSTSGRPGRALPPAAAGLVELQRRLRLRLRRLGLRQHARSTDGSCGGAAPGARRPPRPTRSKDAAYAGTVIGERALDFIAAPATPATRRTSSRSRSTPRTTAPSPSGHYPGDPLFPPMFRTAPAQRQLRAGRVPQRSTVKDLPGFGDDRADNRPATRNGTPRDGEWNTAGRTVGRRGGADLRDRARMAQSVDRMVRQDPGRRRRRTPTSCSPPTTASTSASTGWAAARARRTTPTSHVPLLVVGPGVVPGHARGGDDQHRPRADLRGARRPAARRRTAPGPRWCRPSASPAWCSAYYVFFEHTQQTLADARTPTRRSPAPSSTGSRRTSPCAAATALLVRFDLDPTRDAHVVGL